jgi:two-component system cell cycle sensor histidine kinase/response regulator CckA
MSVKPFWLESAGALFPSGDGAETVDPLIAAGFDGVVVHDRHRVLKIDARGAALWGYVRQEMLGRPLSRFFPPGALEAIEAALQAGTSRIETSAMRSSGEVFHVELSVGLRGDSVRAITGIRDITKRVESQAEAHRREELFRLLADAAFDGFAITKSGRIESSSVAFAAMFGYRPEHLSEMPIDQLLTHLPDGGSPERRQQKGRGTRRNRACFPIAVCAAAAANGHVVYGVRDISSETQAEERLIESERHYRELSESSHDLICKHDLDGRILEVNSAACRTIGYAREQLLAMTLQDLLSERSAAHFREYLAAVVRDGVAEGVMTLLSASGEHRRWQFRNVLEVAGVQRPVVRGLARDVTEQERAIRALHENEEYFRSIIENASDIITTISPAGTIEYHTAATTRTLGYPANEFTGRRFSDLVHPDEAPAVIALFERQLADPAATAELGVRLRHNDGSWRWIALTISSRRIGGHVRSVIVNGHDVTTSRQLHAQLEQANRVNGLGKLAATVAHEFNNVLMGMLPFAELMQRPNVSPAVIEKGTRYIINSVARGKRVALDILRFTRPAEPALQPVDLAEWWAQFGQEMQNRLSDAIVLESAIPDGLILLADADQLSQMFSNMIVNARDAMPKGGNVSLRARFPNAGERFPFGFVPDPQAFAHIELEDNGSGMSPEVVEHVFDPLFTTKQNGGTGLGMAVTHNIVTSHGGSIFVVSKPGVGTTFHIFLPLAQRPPVVALPEAPVATKSPAIRQILIVDDEPMIADGLAEALQGDGRITTTARSAAECEAIVSTLRPDFIILDVSLPDADGFELGARLRRRFPNVRILFSSGHADSRTMVDDPNTGFLQKPFDAQTLFAAIAALEEVPS